MMSENHQTQQLSASRVLLQTWPDQLQILIKRNSFSWVLVRDEVCFDDSTEERCQVVLSKQRFTECFFPHECCRI